MCGKQGQVRICSRYGSVLVIVAVFLVCLIAIAAFVIDLAYIPLARTELQNSADACAHGGIMEFIGAPGNNGKGHAKRAAREIAELNAAGYGEILREEDIKFGVWDSDTRTFTETNNNITAIKVTVYRSRSNNNPVPLFFGRLFAINSADVAATAIAAKNPATRAYGHSTYKIVQ